MLLSPPPGAQASPVQSWAGQQHATANTGGLSQDEEGQEEEDQEEAVMSGGESSESESESPDGSSVMRAIELD